MSTTNVPSWTKEDISTREFEKNFTEMATKLTKDEAKDLYSEIKKESYSYFQKFYIYNVLFTLERRLKNFEKCHKLYDEYYSLFKDEEYFQHTYSIVLKNDATPYSLKRAEEILTPMLSRTRSNTGIQHNFAEILVQNLETQSFDFKDFENKYITALEILDRCIFQEPEYAKFYATKARLLASKKQFAESKMLLNKAISLEKPSRNDYAIRINDYAGHLHSIQIRENTQSINKTMEESLKKFEKIISDIEKRNEEKINAIIHEKSTQLQAHIDDSKNSNIEFLGFFAAILSFTIGSFQLGKDRSLQEASQLIFFLIAGLLLAFSGLSYLTNTKSTFKKTVSLFVLGLIILFLAAFILPKIL